MDIRKYFKVHSVNKKLLNTNYINEPPNINIQQDSLQLVENEIINNKYEYKVFVDGSAFNNGRKNCKGGMGIFFSDDDAKNRSIRLEDKKITNNVAELKACIEAIKIIVSFNNHESYKIIIYSDSQYTINSIVKWAKLWEFNDWNRKDKSKKNMIPIKNKELIIELYKLYNKYPIRFKHVRSHQRKPENEHSQEYFEWYGNMMADKLAKNATSL